VVGDLDVARRRADDMCAHLPPLVAEEWSIEHDEGLGNTPLSWSHTEAARSLHQLTHERIRRRYGTVVYRAWRTVRYLRLRAHAHRSGCPFRSTAARTPARAATRTLRRCIGVKVRA